jgi:photosystem II stability/assembly factor-like uncharacterized protein
MKNRLFSRSLAAGVCLALACLFSIPLQAQSSGVNPKLYEKLKFRAIGPFRGGRVCAVAGVPSQPDVYYFGATGGGVWKTTDGGINWEAVADGQIGTGSVGAIAVAESDPNVIYAGMGESTWRGNVSHGDGVYKSVDAGKTWKHVGLRDTRHIGRIRIHPKNPDIVYVAAMGHAFGPNAERGVFRSRDGGVSWEKVLYRSPKAGAVDLAFDPSNPRTIYAGFWEAIRKPHAFESGGEGSGLFKSTDGGDSWKDISRNSGLPQTTLGKIGVAVSPVNPERVWASVEAEEGGIFRSDDAGETWTRINQDRNLRQRAWYYSHIYADPKNADTVYVLNVGFHKSNDGGRTFTVIPTPHGDNHDLWIAPDDPRRMIEGNDGGANVTTNGGKTWTEQDQPTAQFYRVTTDNAFPYHIYGAQQDNSTVKISSRSADFAIGVRDWHDVGGGESGWIAPHPTNPDVTFAGSYGGLITRYDHRTGQTRDVTVYPDNPMGSGAEAMKYRFQWNFPIAFSRHEPNTLYTGGNIVFKTTDEGQSWEPISPDLTRNDPSKLGPTGGPITKDNTSVEYYCTVFTLAESPLQRGTLWAGSDDGLIHVTRDGGGKWENVTGKDMPEWIQINSIEASPYEAGGAYVAATMYKSDDFRPYLFKTSDYGRTWKKITTGIPLDSFTRVIRADPRKRGLLYAGTETGLYVSFNDGDNWQPLQLNLPAVPITDLAVQARENDLIVATQGRAFWVLDNLEVVQQFAEKSQPTAALLLQPEDAWRMDGFTVNLPKQAPYGANPANGASIFFYLPEKPSKSLVLTFADANGKPIRTFSGKPKDGKEESAAGGRRGRTSDTFTYEVGLNRFVWNLRHPDAVTIPGMILWAADTGGPRVVPGKYQVTLAVDGVSQTQSFEVKKDPRIGASAEDFAAQFDLLMKIREKLSETHRAILNIRELKKQLDDAVTRTDAKSPDGKSVADAAKALKEKLTAIEETLCQPKIQSSQDPLNYPIRLNNKLAALAGVVGGADAAPTRQALTAYSDLTAKIDAQLRRLDEVMNADVPEFNRQFREKSLPALRGAAPEEK